MQEACKRRLLRKGPYSFRNHRLWLVVFLQIGIAVWWCMGLRRCSFEFMGSARGTQRRNDVSVRRRKNESQMELKRPIVSHVDGSHSPCYKLGSLVAKFVRIRLSVCQHLTTTKLLKYLTLNDDHATAPWRDELKVTASLHTHEHIVAIVEQVWLNIRITLQFCNIFLNSLNTTLGQVIIRLFFCAISQNSGICFLKMPLNPVRW